MVAEAKWAAQSREKPEEQHPRTQKSHSAPATEREDNPNPEWTRKLYILLINDTTSAKIWLICVANK